MVENLNSSQVERLSSHKARLHRCMMEASRDLNGLAWSAEDDAAMVKVDGWLFDMAQRGATLPESPLAAVEQSLVTRGVTLDDEPNKYGARRLGRSKQIDDAISANQSSSPSAEDGKL